MFVYIVLLSMKYFSHCFFVSSTMHFVIFITIFVFSSSVSYKIYGEYYVDHEGYIPTAKMGDPVSYTMRLTGPKNRKLISAKFYISRKIGPLGVRFSLKRKSDQSSMMSFEIPNMCSGNYSMEPFQERFSGRIDDNCCIEAGNYTLTDWTVEDHIKPAMKEIFYGRHTYDVKMMENMKTVLWEYDLVVAFKDRDTLRKTDENPGEVENTHENSTRRSRGNRNRGRK